MKQYILLAVAILAALGFWLVTKPLFGQPFSFGQVGSWLWPMVFLAFLTGLMVLSFLLLDSRKSWLVIIINLAVFVFLFNPTEIVLWGGVGMALLLQLSARQAVQGESKNRLRLNLRSALHSGIGRLITSILILVSFAYFLNSGIREEAQRNELPGIVRQAVQVVVAGYIGEGLERQNPSLRAQATETVLNQITNFLKPYFVFVPPVMAFGLFLILQGLSFVFVWLGIILAMLIFWILKLLKLVTIDKETAEKELIKF